MGEINIPASEMEALKTVDTELLDRLIDRCLHEAQAAPIRALRLESCGQYVASQLRQFERALAEHGKAKAAKKRSETEYDARRAGSDLAHAVHQMKHRVVTEEQEGQLFYVDDQIMPPFSLSEQLSVRISYRWRESVEDNWKHGSIAFAHDVILRPHYMTPAPARKPSAAKQERDRQDGLYRVWEHLKSQGLQAVRDHFRRGGSGAAIPTTLQAKADSHTGGLNNFSVRF